MKFKALSITGSVLMAVWMTSNTVHAQSKENKSETIHPPLSGPGASVGGSRSERTGPGVPLPEGSRESGTVERGKSPSGSSNRSTSDSSENLKAVQQALKDKGYDPGPINGVMTPQTTAAIKSFQSASKISPTGTLTAETSAKLGVQSESSGSGSSGTRNTKSSDTTVGKDTDQPNKNP